MINYSKLPSYKNAIKLVFMKEVDFVFVQIILYTLMCIFSSGNGRRWQLGGKSVRSLERNAPAVANGLAWQIEKLLLPSTKL